MNKKWKYRKKIQFFNVIKALLLIFYTNDEDEQFNRDSDPCISRAASRDL